MEKQKLIIASFILSIFLLIVKFFAWYITRSNIVLTDAMESIINVVASGFAWYSIYLSSQPKDANHPYGHGKIEFFAAGLEGGLIMAAGLFIIIKSGYNFFISNEEPDQLGVGVILLASTAVINLAAGFWFLKEGKAQQSIIIEAEGKHLLSDNITTMIGISGLLIVHVSGFHNLDNTFSIILAIFIIYNGYRITRPSIGGLMDETDLTVVEKVIGIMSRNRHADWIDIHNLRVQKYGAALHVDCHLTIPYYYSLKESHELVHELEMKLKESNNQEVEIFIHADPCIPELNCKICMVENCAVRLFPFSKKIEWTVERLMKNEKHSL